MRLSLAVLTLLLTGAPLAAQAPLRSGPMVGWVDLREARLWVQTTRAARVRFVYWDSTTPAIRHRTVERRTTDSTAFTLTLVADSVRPGRIYHYQLLLDGRPVTRPYPTRFRTPPIVGAGRDSVPTLRIALGSCFYVADAPYDRPGTVYGQSTEIMRSIAGTRPDLMLWLGDNTYLREGDWTTRTGILHRWSHTRAEPQLQPLLAAAANFGTWDDHEYGPNDADRAYRDKHLTREAFDLFFPQPRNGAAREGLYTMMEFGDVAFFLLDDRWFRSPNTRTTGDRIYWGEAQLEWLIDALRSSRAAVKIVANGGQVLNPLAVYENASTYPAERQRLLDRLAAERIPGVLFVSGDRHQTELTRLERPGTYPLHDFTVSPLTAGPVTGPAEPNGARVEGTWVAERNFGLIEVTGPRDNRTLTLSVHRVDGTRLWARTVAVNDLQ